MQKGEGENKFSTSELHNEDDTIASPFLSAVAIMFS
jgi:hypothetical protein